MSTRPGLLNFDRRPARGDLAALPPDVRRLVKAARRRRGGSLGSVSRRSVLAGGGAVALGACGIGDDSAQPDGDGSTEPLQSTIVEDRSDEVARVRWANWDAYIDEDDDGNNPSLQLFTEDTGIEVEYSVAIDDIETFYSQVRPLLEARQDIGYDLFSAGGGWSTARYIRNGYCQELDESNIPNKGNIAPQFLNVDFDPGRVFSVPWQAGYAGIAWNTEQVPDGIRTLDDLWRPELDGRVVVLSEMRDTIGIIMMSQGIDIDSAEWSEDDFEAAIAVLEERLASGQIRQVRGNSYMEDLANDDALVSFAWSGDIPVLNAESDRPRWQWGLPETGGTLWFDDNIVPITSEFKTNAERVINHYLDPEIAALVSEWVQYITPVDGTQEVMQTLNPELAEDPLIFPTEEFLQQVQVFRTLTADEEERYAARFQETIGN